jgi:ribosomal protein S17E
MEKEQIKEIASEVVKEYLDNFEYKIKHNIWLVERNLSLFMIKQQRKKFFKNKSFEIYYSEDNPFKEEIQKELNK